MAYRDYLKDTKQRRIQYPFKIKTLHCRISGFYWSNFGGSTNQILWFHIFQIVRICRLSPFIQIPYVLFTNSYFTTLPMWYLSPGHDSWPGDKYHIGNMTHEWDKEMIFWSKSWHKKHVNFPFELLFTYPSTQCKKI